MQISYHYALTKIQKLKKLKKKKKKNFFSVSAKIGYEMLMFRYWYGTYRPVRPIPIRY